MNENWKIRVEHGNKLYIITNNEIDIYKYTNKPYSNGFGTIYRLHGRKTVSITEYNSTWACRGMGMNDRRYTTLVSEELYNKIRRIIDEIKTISNTELNEDEKYEKYVEVLKEIDVDTFYDYISESDC
jgi:urease gamma subunit